MLDGRKVDFLLLKEYFMENLCDFSNVAGSLKDRFTRESSGIEKFP